MSTFRTQRKRVCDWTLCFECCRCICGACGFSIGCTSTRCVSVLIIVIAWYMLIFLFWNSLSYSRTMPITTSCSKESNSLQGGYCWRTHASLEQYSHVFNALWFASFHPISKCPYGILEGNHLSKWHCLWNNCYQRNTLNIATIFTTVQFGNTILWATLF